MVDALAGLMAARLQLAYGCLDRPAGISAAAPTLARDSRRNSLNTT